MSHVRRPKHSNKWLMMPKNRQDQLNRIYAEAKDLAVDNLELIVSELFPDAVPQGNYFRMSNMLEGGEGSMWIYRKGPKRGAWVDAGNPKTSRATGDVIHLVAEKEFNGNTWEACEFIIGVVGR